ncbi:hypothetical protein HMPREF1014_04781 [Bacillus sp. 7_6_55CFAA_CT2]|nr:hypothetical protein HMPREF1014_04781 [Bacillus sp. 7_6_55CFAA_CT2]
MDLSVATELENSNSIIPIDEHFKLYAGPGAGKTTFLTNHIKRILHQSTKLGKAKKLLVLLIQILPLIHLSINSKILLNH